MSDEPRPRVPIELWLFIMGSIVYWILYRAIPSSPQAPFLPANPPGLFAPLTAWFFLRWRERRAYWVTVVIAGLAALYPVRFSSWMRLFGDPSTILLAWIFVPPALLLALMLSPRVRRYAKSRPDRQTSSSMSRPTG
jgi:hypothetical protein